MALLSTGLTFGGEGELKIPDIGTSSKRGSLTIAPEIKRGLDNKRLDHLFSKVKPFLPSHHAYSDGVCRVAVLIVNRLAGIVSILLIPLTMVVA